MGGSHGGEADRLYERVARDLEQAIEFGRYRSGSRLPSERDLSEQYGVSRPVIREALIALEVQGLLQRGQDTGIYVKAKTSTAHLSQASAASPFEVTEARRLLEGEVAALVASVATDEQITELEIVVGAIGDLTLDQSSREQADRAFHVMLARATANDVLVGLVETLWDMRYQSPLCIYFFNRARQAGSEPPADEHRLILQALQARDANGARSAMREHLAGVTENLLAATEADLVDRARLRVDERRLDFARRAGLEVAAEM